MSVKPPEVLNLAVRNIFYVQSAFTYNMGSTLLIDDTIDSLITLMGNRLNVL